MNWNRNPNDGISDLAEDLTYPSHPGKIPLVLLGIVLPLVLAGFAASCWMDEQAFWFSSSRFGHGIRPLNVTGDTARALAVTWLGAAAFFHFRWFWGALGWQRTFIAGLVFSIIVCLGSCSTAFFLEMAP